MLYKADDVDKMSMKRKTMKKQLFDKDEMPEDQKARESLTDENGQFVMAGGLKVKKKFYFVSIKEFFCNKKNLL
jgi:hypothetical protein